MHPETLLNEPKKSLLTVDTHQAYNDFLMPLRLQKKPTNATPPPIGGATTTDANGRASQNEKQKKFEGETPPWSILPHTPGPTSQALKYATDSEEKPIFAAVCLLFVPYYSKLSYYGRLFLLPFLSVCLSVFCACLLLSLFVCFCFHLLLLLSFLCLSCLLVCLLLSGSLFVCLD